MVEIDRNDESENECFQRCALCNFIAIFIRNKTDEKKIQKKNPKNFNSFVSAWRQLKIKVIFHAANKKDLFNLIAIRELQNGQRQKQQQQNVVEKYSNHSKSAKKITSTANKLGQSHS